MAGMIDGVSKVFMVEAKAGSMHFNGFKSQREMVEDVARFADFWNEGGARNHIAWLESLKATIDAHILATKQDYELDGHKALDRSGESDG